MLSNLQYGVLRRLYRGNTNVLSGSAYHNKSKLQVLLGSGIFDKIENKIVVDFGCGYGEQTLELARNGARLAIGLDIRDEVLQAARTKADGLSNVRFVSPEECPNAIADFVISLDSFEHFLDPAQALTSMCDLLMPGGQVLASFGPPWLHPLGGHDFSIFPWAHVVLSERALCRWYSETRKTRIARFEDVSGGLNRMTIGNFRKLVERSPFSEASIEAVPIRKLRLVHNQFTQEFTTSIIRCVLTKRG